jgi:hypothetical protein
MAKLPEKNISCKRREVGRATRNAASFRDFHVVSFWRIFRHLITHAWKLPADLSNWRRAGNAGKATGEKVPQDEPEMGEENGKSVRPK